MSSYVGLKLGKLTIIEDLGYCLKQGTKAKKHYVKCRCECGSIVTTRLDHMKHGSIISCGCYSKEESGKRFLKKNKKYNKSYIDDSGIVHVILFNTKNEMLCNLADWEMLRGYCWSEDRQKGYARARDVKTQKVVMFHQLVLALSDGMIPDHINGNRLDNRRCNLRPSTKSQNAMNSKIRIDNKTGYKGIRKLPSGNYYVRIKVNGKEIGLGTFNNIEDAINARQEAEIKYFGEYRRVI